MLRSALTSLSSLVLLASLAGCASGGGTSISVPITPINPVSNNTSVYVTQIAGTYPNNYSTILRFTGSASGVTTPAATLTPPANFIAVSIATDSSGNVYAAGSLNHSVGDIGEVVVFSAGSTTPTRILSGPATQLPTASPQSIAVDASGQIYVAGINGDVHVFAANANGNGNVLATRVFTAPSAAGTGLAVDSTGNVYLGSFLTRTIFVFGPTATGAATPIRTITGASTLLGDPFALALDNSNNLYVGSYTGTGATDAILVFSAGATGNITPSRTIVGASTGFNSLTGMAVDSAGRVYEADVANFANNTSPSVNVFTAAAAGNAAPNNRFTSTQWTATGDSNIAVF